MRLSKIPMPLLIAALVATTVVVIHLQLTVVPVPVVADGNYTGTLVAGSPYLWRGAASEIGITSNATIRMTYMPVGHVVYLSGPLSNASLGPDRWLIYANCRGPILVEKVTSPGGATRYYVFKLVNVSKVNGLSVFVPQPFDATELLNQKEINATRVYTGASEVWRIVRVYTNGTHILLDYAPLNQTSTRGTFVHQLPPAMNGTAFRITSRGYGVSYTVNNVSVSVYVMPYQHIVIVPINNARVSITVK